MEVSYSNNTNSIENEFTESFKDDKLSYSDQLIRELNKKPFRRAQLRSLRFYQENSNTKNPQKITSLLMKLPGFIKYIKIHNLDEESIRNASNFLTCLYCPKNKYVFHQLDESDAFYGIIKGKISLQSEIYQYEDKDEKKENMKRKKTVLNLKSPINNEDKYTLIEETIFVLSDGYCFGEWGLVNDTRRVTSAKAIEDTYLFVLEKKDFKSSLYHCYFKLIAERNNFIKNNIVPMKNCLSAIYNKLSPLITPLHPDKGNIIYLENSKAELIHVVYQGNCGLYKNFRKLSDEDKLNHTKMKFIKILNLTKGSILGLEAVDGGEYYTTLICESNNTVILQFRLTKMIDIKEELTKYLKNLKNQYDDYIVNFMQKYIKNHENYKIDYRDNVVKTYFSKSNYKDINISIDNKPTEFINDFKNYQILSNSLNKSKDSDYSHDSKDKHILKSYLYELTKLDEKIDLKNNKKIESPINLKSPHHHLSRNCKKGILYFPKIKIEKKIDSFNISQTRSETDRKCNKENDRIEKAIRENEEILYYNMKKNNVLINKTINENKLDTSKYNPTCTTSYKNYSTSPQTISKFKINKRVQISLNKWKDLENSNFYNTGNFDIPLINYK